MRYLARCVAQAPCYAHPFLQIHPLIPVTPCLGRKSVHFLGLEQVFVFVGEDGCLLCACLYTRWRFTSRAVGAYHLLALTIMIIISHERLAFLWSSCLHAFVDPLQWLMALTTRAFHLYYNCCPMRQPPLPHDTLFTFLCQALLQLLERAATLKTCVVQHMRISKELADQNWKLTFHQLSQQLAILGLKSSVNPVIYGSISFVAMELTSWHACKHKE